jgi:hypothetical protein
MTNVSFSKAVEALKEGKLIARPQHLKNGAFIFMQVASNVPANVVPKMQSVPQAAKDVFAKRDAELFYDNQLALATPLANHSFTIVGYSPSPTDTLANDWQIIEVGNL